MSNADKPDVIIISPSTSLDSLRDRLAEAGLTTVSELKPGLLVVYSDRRTIPRVCKRTGMRRAFCCCAPCRALRRRKHHAPCHCWLCYADRMGAFIDELGQRTVSGKWGLFVTLTYRTGSFPWARGFPMEQPAPHPDFVHNFFGRMIRWLEQELQERVEFSHAEQLGEAGGRLHHHAALSSPALAQAAEELTAMLRADPRTTRLPKALKPFAAMLWDKAGLNRILPWEKDAGYYIGRYIGRDAGRCNWDFRVGPEPVRLLHPVGRKVVAVSAAPDESSRAYRNTIQRWHR
jgi:hypothetical protein